MQRRFFHAVEEGRECSSLKNLTTGYAMQRRFFPAVQEGRECSYLKDYQKKNQGVCFVEAILGISLSTQGESPSHGLHMEVYMLH